jgi:cell division ATPase FtsA
MSFFSFLKRNKESYSLVFNIGSGSVSGGIIKFTQEVGVDVSYYIKENIPFQQEVSIPKHLDLMKEAVTALAHHIQSDGLKKINADRKGTVLIDRAFYIFSSPWSASQTKTIRIKEAKPIKLTENYINKIIDDESKQFQENVALSGTVIEKKIIQIKINGYVVSDISNKVAQDLEISVLFTVVPEKILQIVEQSISKVFNIKNIWCHSLSLATLSVIRNLFPQKEDFIQIDISEEITDISIIRNNIISSSASIPHGRNHFIRELSLAQKVTEEVADSMIRMHFSKHRDELASLKLAVTMDAVSKLWLSKVSDVLEGLKEKAYVPDSIFLIASTDLASFLKDKLEKQDYGVIAVDNNSLKSPLVKDDLILRLELMFLDNLYKI